MNILSLVSKFRPALALTLLSLTAGSLTAQFYPFPPVRPCPAPVQPVCVPGTIEFFAGNNGCGKSLGGHRATAGRKGVPNDEVRSLVLTNVAPGTVIRLFDDGRGRGCDDWVEIRIKAQSPRIVIGSLEQSRNDAFVEVTYYCKNGLDGKVSCVTVGR
jgi:hypothetical protein